MPPVHFLVSWFLGVSITAFYGKLIIDQVKLGNFIFRLPAEKFLEEIKQSLLIHGLPTAIADCGPKYYYQTPLVKAARALLESRLQATVVDRVAFEQSIMQQHLDETQALLQSDVSGVKHRWPIDAGFIGLMIVILTVDGFQDEQIVFPMVAAFQWMASIALAVEHYSQQRRLVLATQATLIAKLPTII